MREVAPRVLSENEKISNPNANVDIASGTLLHHVGLTDPEYYTTFFGWARVAGIGAQIVDERTKMRDGKGGSQSTDQNISQKPKACVILNKINTMDVWSFHNLCDRLI